MNAPVTTMIESPYAAPTEAGVHENLAYLARCLMDSVARGEAPFASHGFYTMFLDDRDPQQRAQGLACADAWAARAEQIVFYVDRGISPGMLARLESCVPDIGQWRPVYFRSLDNDAAWMRQFIDALPAHIRTTIDRVSVR